MKTDTINISVSSKLAKEYNTISEPERKKIGILFDMIFSRLQNDPRTLEEISKQATEMAKKNGLTAKILKNILNEKKA